MHGDVGVVLAAPVQLQVHLRIAAPPGEPEEGRVVNSGDIPRFRAVGSSYVQGRIYRYTVAPSLHLRVEE